MALLFLDGFDHYSTNAQALRKWSSASGGNPSGAGRFGRGLTYSTTTGAVYKALGVNAATLVAGVAHQQSLPTTGTKIIEFRDSGSSQVYVAVDTDFKLSVYRNGTLISQQTATWFTVKAATWFYVELKVTFHVSAGTVDLKVNGTSILSLTGQNTRATANSFANQAGFTGGGSGSVTNLFDDFYCCDTSTATNNDFLGEVEVRTTFPTGDSAVQYTRSTGATNALNVDDNPPNDDTDYNEDSVVGHKDIFTLTALSPTVTTVKSVALSTTMRNTDASARTGRANLKSNATTVNGVSIALGTSYAVQQDIFDTDPNGAIAWTPTSANASLPGYEVVA